METLLCTVPTRTNPRRSQSQLDPIVPVLVVHPEVDPPGVVDDPVVDVALVLAPVPPTKLGHTVTIIVFVQFNQCLNLNRL